MRHVDHRGLCVLRAFLGIVQQFLELEREGGAGVFGVVLGPGVEFLKKSHNLVLQQAGVVVGTLVERVDKGQLLDECQQHVLGRDKLVACCDCDETGIL